MKPNDKGMRANYTYFIVSLGGKAMSEFFTLLHSVNIAVCFCFKIRVRNFGKVL